MPIRFASEVVRVGKSVGRFRGGVLPMGTREVPGMRAVGEIAFATIYDTSTDSPWRRPRKGKAVARPDTDNSVEVLTIAEYRARCRAGLGVGVRASVPVGVGVGEAVRDWQVQELSPDGHWVTSKLQPGSLEYARAFYKGMDTHRVVRFGRNGGVIILK